MSNWQQDMRNAYFDVDRSQRRQLMRTLKVRDSVHAIQRMLDGLSDSEILRGRAEFPVPFDSRIESVDVYKKKCDMIITELKNVGFHDIKANYIEGEDCVLILNWK